MSEDRWAEPQVLDKVTRAFPANARDFMPTMEECGEPPRQWIKWQQEWFFRGLKGRPTPKPGIDLETAMQHLAAIQGSFAPKHEHKEAAVAYLASRWFESPDSAPVPHA